MKRFILHTLFVYAIFIGNVVAQVFPKTFTDNSCANCLPPGYTIQTGGPVALSNMAGIGGNPLKNWVNANGFPGTSFLPPPSSAKAIDANKGNVFLTLKYNGAQQDKVRAFATGFEIGMKYTIHYYVMTARAHLTAATISDYAVGAKLDVIAYDPQGGSSPVTSKTTNFTAASNDTWVEQTLTFVAPMSNLYFELSALGSQQSTSYVNFDIYSKPFDCVVPGGQVELYRSTVNTPFACESINLYDLIKTPTPPGTLPVWSVNSTHGFVQMTPEEASHAKSSTVGEDYFVFFKSTNECFNVDISNSKAILTTIPTQASLVSNQQSINCISQTGVNLNAQISPTNYKVHWFTDDKHQGVIIDNPQAAPVGTYYAFYFDSKNNCYSVDKAGAGAIFSVVGSTMCCNDPNDPSKQIPLLNTDVKITAPAQTYDLTQLVPSNFSLPPNVALEWYTTANHSGSPIADPKHVGAGKYYVFAHDTQNGCFNMALSKIGVMVSKDCNAGTTPVSLKKTLGFYCEVGEPAMTLNDFVVGIPPAGVSVVWYDNEEHTGNPVTVAQTEYLPIYYAFFYDDVNKCFSPPSAGLNVQSKQVPVLCTTGEDGCQFLTGCPSGGVNLNALHSGPVPNGWELRWYNNRKHSGQQVATPDNVTEAGDYYAFYYSPSKQCYNKSGVQANGTDDLSNKKITVVNPQCGGPKLDIRVVLQGARMTGSGDDIMHNNLQTYIGNNSGLLPTTSPYGDLATSAQINNPAIMSNVVDWIRVEIRDAVDPSVLLESKSLILFVSGFIGNLDGTLQPSFTSQSKPVRIVIKHRNHLAIMSNPIQDFSSGVVSYDFTTALSQASNEFGDPPQMIQKNGIWCMWVGDLNGNQDLGVDATDSNEVYKTNQQDSSYDIYVPTDINMDGGVDSNDRNLIYLNNLIGPISTLINY